MTADLDAFLDKTYGFPASTWQLAQKWLTARLRRVAAVRDGETISYSELCDEMRKRNVIELEPHGTPLAGLLGQINVMEHDQGNPPNRKLRLAVTRAVEFAGGSVLLGRGGDVVVTPPPVRVERNALAAAPMREPRRHQPRFASISARDALTTWFSRASAAGG